MLALKAILEKSFSTEGPEGVSFGGPPCAERRACWTCCVVGMLSLLSRNIPNTAWRQCALNALLSALSMV